MTEVAPSSEGATPGSQRPTAAPSLGPDGTANPAPRIFTALPGQVIDLPFTLAAATVVLRDGDLYIQSGGALVVIEGYGPALMAGKAPTVVDPRGDTLALEMPEIRAGNEVILTDGPEPPPPPPAEFTTAGEKRPPFGGALLTFFDPVSGSLLRSFRAAGTGPEDNGGGDPGRPGLRPGGAPVPDFGAIGLARSGATLSALGPDPFAAKDDAAGVLRGFAAGNVISGWGVDSTTGGLVSEATGKGAAVPVTAGGVDVAGQFGTLHIAADGSASYQRTVGSVTDLAGLPNGATDLFTYTLVNGDGRSDTATLSIRLMPETMVAGDATGTGDDEALVLQAGAAGQLSGLGGEDRLFGAGGDDKLLGGDDDDYLKGGAGNDILDPGSGNDTAEGGAGNDRLELGGNLTAADKLDGGADNDTLALDGDYAAGVVFTATTLVNVETITLAAGNSYKLTLADATNSAGLSIDGTALGAGNALSIDGGAETSAALSVGGGAGDDLLTGGGGKDQLAGGDGNDTLTTGSGNDTADGGAGDDVLDLAGNLTAADKLSGGSGNDTLKLAGNYAAGVTFAATTLSEVERIELKAGNSYKLTLADANNAISLTVDGRTLTASNVLTLNGAAETGAALIAEAGAGNDVLTGGGGNDQLNGGAGNDTLTGNAGADLLTAGTGNDSLSGGAGNDRLVLAGNLTAADRIDGGADSDTLELAGNYAAGVTFTATTLTNVEAVVLAAGNSYKFTLNDANNSAGLTIDGSALAAANSLTVNGAAETSAALTASGGAGNDVLTGGAGKDMLSGNAGNDTLTGNNGDDTLIAGTGTDTLAGSNGNDMLDLGAGLDAADKIDGGANSDTLKLDGDYGAGLVFNATTVTNVETFLLAAGHDYNLKLTDANNTTGITVNAAGLAAGNRLVFDGSAETASLLNATGGAGNDVLIGGGGNDTLTGGAGNDTLTSGSGNDLLSGGAGDDMVIMNAGLTTGDKIDGGADFDILRFTGGVSVNVTLGVATITNVEQIELIGSSYRLVLNDATAAGALKIDGSTLVAGQTINIDGAAETSAALTLLGGAGNDTLGGGAGNDLLSGGGSNDTITTGAGIDTVSGGDGNDSILLAGNLTAADAIDGGNGTDTVTLKGDYSAGLTLGATTITNIEIITLGAGNSYKLTLDDATNGSGLTVNASALAAANALTLDGSAETSAALTVTGGAGNDVVAGGAGNDVISAGAGNDSLSGNAGADIFLLGANFTAADQIDGGADADTLSLNGNYAAGIVFTATTLTNVESITLAAGNSYKLTLNDATNVAGLSIDGTLLGASRVLTVDGSAETSAALTATGGTGNDVLIGGAGSDSLSGGGGNDAITTGAGNDTVEGGAGNDTIVLAANLTAADQIDGGADTDTLTLSGNYSAGVVFGATTVRNVETITVAAGNNYKLTLDDATNVSGLTVNASALAAANALTLDGAAELSAALTVLGGAGSDVVTGGGGGDKITSGAGVDTLSGGAGSDTFTLAGNLTAADRIDGGADADTLSLNGNYAAGIVFGATTLTNVEAIALADGNSYKFTLNDATNTAGLSIDGSLLSAGRTLTVIGTAETNAALSAIGGKGNDALTGGGGGDTLTGGAGNDALVGNGGGDTLVGGSGNDSLTGGTGADTFEFHFAETGKDTVADFKLAQGDRLVFTQILDGAGSDIQDLIDAGFSASGSGGNCVISWNGGASTVTLTGVGGTVTSLNDLATLLGPQLQVSH
jgi:Ca2+-binding RTX toxin-like protein